MSTNLTRSIQELNVRYVRFCLKHELDETVPAAEQYAENEKQQLWLDKHIEALQEAKINGKLLARGKTDVVRDIVSDINSQFETATTINVKATAKRISRKINSIIDVVCDYQPRAAVERCFNICPSPMSMQQSKKLKHGEVQLGFPVTM